jgi:sugar phosphate isomerase/epimerase
MSGPFGSGTSTSSPSTRGATTGLSDLSRLCVHTITTKPWSLEQAAEAYAAAGVKGITVWRDALEGRSAAASGERLARHGLRVVSLCRGGFFAHVDEAARAAALDDNRRAIDEAAALGAPLVVLVCGAHPGQTLNRSRAQIQQGIEALLPYAEQHGVRLAIEPLHPMYADSRSAINTLGQANDLAIAIGSDLVGVAVDVYHVWWDTELEGELARAGSAGKLFAFHVCDWKTPTVDLLLDRGLPGEGCIDVRGIRAWVERAGFHGFIEVEIFSKAYWEMDQRELLSRIVEAYRAHV